MNDATIDSVITSSEALIAALDAHDVEAIEAALPPFGESIKALKAVGAWEGSPRLSARLVEAMKLADGARARVRYLADRTQQQIDMLATAAGRFDAVPATYARPGR